MQIKHIINELNNHWLRLLCVNDFIIQFLHDSKLIAATHSNLRDYTAALGATYWLAGSVSAGDSAAHCTQKTAIAVGETKWISHSHTNGSARDSRVLQKFQFALCKTITAFFKSSCHQLIPNILVLTIWITQFDCDSSRRPVSGFLRWNRIRSLSFAA